MRHYLLQAADQEVELQIFQELLNEISRKYYKPKKTRKSSPRVSWKQLISGERTNLEELLILNFDDSLQVLSILRV
jgi:hypothetical protein